jgi:hypothetical protein
MRIILTTFIAAELADRNGLIAAIKGPNPSASGACGA